MLASRPAATLLRPVLWVGSMTDVRPAADLDPGLEDLREEASVSQFVRLAALAVVSLNAVLAAIELGRLALATASASFAGLAAQTCVQFESVWKGPRGSPRRLFRPVKRLAAR